MRRSRWPPVVTAAVLVFLWLPIAVLAANSFNRSRFGSSWEGLSLRWYRALLADADTWRALRNSLVVGVGATLTSLALGTSAAVALHRHRSRLQRLHYALVYSPLVVPDLLMGMSLLVLFVALGADLGLGTVYLAHTTFCVSYVAMVVLARLQDFDPSILEAARDLGAGRWTVVRRVLLPLLAPGLAAAGLLAFTLSIDDFVITFFVAGPGATTLPVRVYSMIKHSRNLPAINALSVLMLAATFTAVRASRRLLQEDRP